MRKIFILALSAIAIISICAFSNVNSSSDTDLKETITLSKDFHDISGTHADGSIAKLSDYLGKGNYVLVDFWASWCGPCRAETPYITKVYEQYKDKGLTVVGIAVSDKRSDSIKAIKDLGIQYEQILDSNKDQVSKYGFNTIPNIFLFSPTGEIVQRGMRGDGIAEAVAKVIK